MAERSGLVQDDKPRSGIQGIDALNSHSWALPDFPIDQRTMSPFRLPDLLFVLQNSTGIKSTLLHAPNETTRKCEEEGRMLERFVWWPWAISHTASQGVPLT
jgi:hypothetical protein